MLKCAAFQENSWNKHFQAMKRILQETTKTKTPLLNFWLTAGGEINYQSTKVSIASNGLNVVNAFA